MTHEDDELKPWQRAGGYPFEDWRKVMLLATERHVAAAQARAAYLDGRSMTFEEIRRLREADEAAAADYRAVFAGDSEVVGRLFDDVTWADAAKDNE